MTVPRRSAFALLLLLCGCNATIEKPYIKETTTHPDGSVTVREISAERIGGSKPSDINKIAPK